MSNNSLLITIEGIDGSGKTTLIKNLKKKDKLNLITHNWRDTEIGQKVWNLIDWAKGENNNGLPSDWSYIFLIFIAFEELVKEVIEPKLNESKIVIIDRYIDSTFVYQGLSGGLGVDLIQEIAEKTAAIPMPNITFILDIDPLNAQERLKKRKVETGEYTNWDKLDLEFHQRVRNYYLELKKTFPNRICIIDASQSEDEVLKEVWDIIEQSYSLQNQQKESENLPRLSRVVIENAKGQILLVKDKKWGWNFPGGKVEKGETPLETAKREVVEETNLVIENFELIAEENIFFPILEKGNQHWKGYFYRTNKYSGEIKNKEIGKILDIKFVDYHSPEAREGRSAYQKFFRKYKEHERK